MNPIYVVGEEHRLRLKAGVRVFTNPINFFIPVRGDTHQCILFFTDTNQGERKKNSI